MTSELFKTIAPQLWLIGQSWHVTAALPRSWFGEWKRLQKSQVGNPAEAQWTEFTGEMNT